MRDDDLDLLDELLPYREVEEAAGTRIRRRAATEAPASLQQRRLWFLSRLDPDLSADNIAATLRLTGMLDLSALSRAIELVVDRHEILRTTFHERDGYPWQIVAQAGRVRDLSSRTGANTSSMRQNWMPCSETTADTSSTSNGARYCGSGWFVSLIRQTAFRSAFA